MVYNRQATNTACILRQGLSTGSKMNYTSIHQVNWKAKLELALQDNPPQMLETKKSYRWRLTLEAPMIADGLEGYV